ncbi:hypothetical protein [Streptomyces globisporus]|uniref:hypothetical protein n=1 Tax=Streptomyces globisporus TaxID=1908 RepID=UPI0004CA5281|nr:hypothetical protein [Streptomyces globisporus]
MAEFLGPLELVGDRWVIGDPKRQGGMCLVLTAEALEHHANGEAEPIEVVPWSRFMELGIRAAHRAWMATRGGTALTWAAQTNALDMGRDACSVHGLVRHPYDDWAARYSHHRRAYTGAHVYLLSHLVEAVSEAKLLHRLGDPQWLAAVVEQVAPLPYRRSSVRAIREIVTATPV